eukprot:CAMPEP_0178422716 /NCGR_PEP_ID=MMETSP0689_2-20121128/27318_1 /TAXON_ID=160604 /ORGANISM="Amphidinium massartii, Strain CS-259" /LENGTH=301 /DNA_ID=CAMNT_0020044291 /DNA_START=33 /DNA_END=938 /DNA_ORIENTATION=+
MARIFHKFGHAAASAAAERRRCRSETPRKVTICWLLPCAAAMLTFVREASMCSIFSCCLVRPTHFSAIRRRGFRSHSSLTVVRRAIPEDFLDESDGSSDGEATSFYTPQNRWEWGEVYIWGGVTWRPEDPEPGTPSEDEERRRKVVWKFVADQYPVAAKEGFFAGNRLTPRVASERFEHLVKNLAIPEKEAYQLLHVDATPLLVEPEGVANAFQRLDQVATRPRALELVKRHPGLLVGGARRMKQGVSLVTAALIDLLFSGRLLAILNDRAMPSAAKLAEIEFYATLASNFKPVIDLFQRR